MLSFANIINTFALSYQTETDIEFTFNPTLSINISPADLIIDNLTPGTTDNSNAINVSVATNSAYGYILTTSTGNNTTYNTTDLMHTSSNNTFSSLSTNANLTSLEDTSDNNIWGYSYKLSGDNTWSNYSGLPLYSSPLKVLLNTDSNTETGLDSLDFKIAAKASTTQPSGAYSNVINFSAVTKPTPTTLAEAYANYYQATNKTMHNGYYVMQDMADSHICENTEVIGSELQVIDIRDDKVYRIAKLADGHCWMTQNLDITGGTTLTSDTTDFDSSYTIPDTQGWQPGSKLPASNAMGFTDNNYAYTYNSNRTECISPGCYSYYSWDTATLGSGRNINTDNTDAPYSICPKGWRLPNTHNGANSSTDFRALIIAYGGSSTIQIYNPSTEPTGTTIYNTIGPNTPPNFILAGNYQNTSFNNGGISGHYWSSTSGSDNSIARGLRIDLSSIYSATGNYRSFGFSIRCLAR